MSHVQARSSSHLSRKVAAARGRVHRCQVPTGARGSSGTQVSGSFHVPVGARSPLIPTSEQHRRRHRARADLWPEEADPSVMERESAEARVSCAGDAGKGEKVGKISGFSRPVFYMYGNRI
jgi:hypothetical protein